MQMNTFWLITFLLGLVWTGLGTYLAWFRPALFRRIVIEPIALTFWWDPSSARWYRSTFYFWQTRLISTVTFIGILFALFFVPDFRAPAPQGELVDTRVLAFVLAGLLLLVHGYLQYLHVANGSPHSNQWRLALFVAGWIPVALFIWGLMVPRGLPEFIVAMALALPVGYIAMKWLPIGVRAAYAEALRNQRKQKEEDRLEDERRGLR